MRSAVAGAAIAVILLFGGLFRASVWDAVRPPIGTAEELSPEPPAPASVSAEGDDRAAAVTGALDGLGSPGEQATADTGTDGGSAPIAAGVDGADPSPDVAEEAASDQGEVPEDPAGEPVAERVQQAAGKLEELTAKLDELTARMEGLTAKLEAPSAPGAPVPVAGPPRPDPAAARADAPPARARPPWLLLPQPEPGSRVPAGSLVLEARARGETPIARVRLVLDAVALPVTLERRGDNVWRALTSTRVAPGPHVVEAAVVDSQGRTGSYRWRFEAGPP